MWIIIKYLYAFLPVLAYRSFSYCLFLVGVRATLTWQKRLKIALDAAKGLAFLHGVEKPIIYRDFKTSNILLDLVSLSLMLNYIK